MINAKLQTTAFICAKQMCPQIEHIRARFLKIHKWTQTQF